MENKILPQLKETDWTVEVIMASSDISKALKPLVRIKMGFEENEPPIEIELSLESFGDLRYKVAEALKIISDVKENKALQH